MRTFIAVVFCIFVISGCEVSVSTASLSEPAISERVNPETMAPLQAAESFLPSVKTLNATVKLNNAPADTLTSARFYKVNGSRNKIAEQQITSSGTGYLNFSLDPPATGWPLGNYVVDYYLAGELKHSLNFQIADKLASVTTAATTEPLAEPQTGDRSRDIARNFRTFKDAQIGFSAELPDDWDFKLVGPQKDYLFHGAEGTDEAQIKVIIRIVDSQATKPLTPTEEINKQRAEFEKANGAQIVKNDVTRIGGVAAPFFLATYPADDLQGNTVSWGHTQLGLLNDSIMLLISYAAPRDIYQNKVDIFQHMMDSVVLTTPETR